MADMGLFEAIHSQRAIRHFKADKVSSVAIHNILLAATRAPSGGNQQPWAFIVITDSRLRDKISEYYSRSWSEAYGVSSAHSSLDSRVYSSAQFLADHMKEVPVLILACIRHDGSPSTMNRGSSIYPAVQNLMLAARGLGLGTVLTTLHKRFEIEIKQLLGIPNDVETAALLPLGYPSDERSFGRSRRRPVDQVTFQDRWGAVWDQTNPV